MVCSNSVFVKDLPAYAANLTFSLLQLTPCPCWCSGSTNSLHNLQMASQGQQPDQSRRQQDEDIFSIVGGCELGADSRHHPLQQARNNVSTNSLGSAAGLPNSSSVGNLSCLGDLPEEQPSRILFIRGLDATVSDEALVQMFEVCHSGHVVTLALVYSLVLLQLCNEHLLAVLAYNFYLATVGLQCS